MKNALFVSCTDLHFTSKRPACRSDEYQKTMLKKFEELLIAAENTRLSLLLCAGDFFDSAKRNIGFSLISDLVQLIQSYKDVNVVSVAGNHDLLFHNNDMTDIPLRVLQESCPNFCILNNEIYRAIDVDDNKHEYLILGEGWNWTKENMKLLLQQENLPIGSTLILLTHTTIFKDKLPDWASPSDSFTASQFILALESMATFDAVISGDNHESFTTRVHGTLLVNSGSMMRSKIDLMDYHPRYAVYTKALNCTGLYVEFVPFTTENNVFNMEYVNEQKEIQRVTNLDFDKFLSEVNSAVSITLDYPTALRHVVKKNYPELKEKLEFLLENA